MEAFLTMTLISMIWIHKTRLAFLKHQATSSTKRSAATSTIVVTKKSLITFAVWITNTVSSKSRLIHLSFKWNNSKKHLINNGLLKQKISVSKISSMLTVIPLVTFTSALWVKLRRTYFKFLKLQKKDS